MKQTVKSWAGLTLSGSLRSAALLLSLVPAWQETGFGQLIYDTPYTFRPRHRIKLADYLRRPGANKFSHYLRLGLLFRVVGSQRAGWLLERQHLGDANRQRSRGFLHLHRPVPWGATHFYRVRAH